MLSIVSFECQRVKSLAREVYFLEDEVLRQSSETLKLKQTTAAMCLSIIAFVHLRCRAWAIAHRPSDSISSGMFMRL
jgi:hypothetical protein